MSKKRRKPKDRCKLCGREFNDDGTGVCQRCRSGLPDERQVLQASEQRERQGGD